jgi:hypothetical protein
VNRGAAPCTSAAWDDERGVIAFAFGQCALTAAGDVLTLRLDAADALQYMKDMVAGRLATIGRRDGLTVTWRA